KMEKVRELFKGLPMVVDFVGKPFATKDVLARAARARKLRAAASTPVVPTPAVPAAGSSELSFKQKEAAANTIFQRLRRQLGAIPESVDKIGSAQPALYFAKKILTPAIVEGLLDGLMPLYREVLAEPAPRTDGAGLSAWPLADVYRLLSVGNRT